MPICADGLVYRVDGEIVTQAQYDAEYRSEEARRRLLNTPPPRPYYESHGPFNMLSLVCQSCGLDDSFIHQHRVPCKPSRR
jgi:hypothetical protein